MKLIKANKIKYTEKKPFPMGEIVGQRWLIVSDKFQIGLLNGKFKVRNLYKNPSYTNEGYYFETLKDAVNFASKL